MRRQQMQTIRRAVNPRMIRSTIAELSVYHRVTSSDQMNGAAEHARKLMEQQGVQTEMYVYPSANKVHLDSTPLCDGWECTQGWCEIVGEPGRHIADYHADPLSVLERSVSCDYRDEPIEVIMMDRGAEEENYADVDFSGKLIFIKQQEGHYFNVPAYTDWAYKRGAVGHILSAVATEENVRGYWNQYDTIAWSSIRNSQSAFGFGLTPREGDRLAKLYEQKHANGEKLLVNCYIEASANRDTMTMSNAMGVIQGETDEEILLYAHLCHPRPSANDKLSGVSAVMEAMRVLSDLINRGFSPNPKRTIRGIVGPEMFGSLAHVYHLGDERAKTRAALNMDMVGAAQGHQGVGPVFLCNTPRAIPSFTFDAASLCMEEIMKDTRYGRADWVCTHNMKTAEYSGGSDHDVYNDPCVGIPCPAMGQWPDRFYHSSSDDIETIDPTLIARSAGIGATYAYLMATLTPEDIPSIMAKGLQNMTQAMVLREMESDPGLYGMAMHHIRDFYLDCCEEYVRFFPGDAHVRAMVDAQKQSIVSTMDILASTRSGHAIRLEDYSYSDYPADERYGYVVRKNFLGRIMILEDLKYNVPDGEEILNDLRQCGWIDKTRGCAGMTLYYCDGKRTMAQAATLAALDNSIDPKEIFEPIHQYFMALEKLGTLTLIRP